MRIALLQIRLDAESRAANLQGLIAAIHRAAETNPAPDLLVLPGGCDTGGACVRRTLDEASHRVVKETIALNAREWGVYIAAGMHVRREGIWVPSPILFDPDGDAVAVGAAEAGGDAGSDAPVALWPCALGRIGVFEPSLPCLAPKAKPLEVEGAFVAVPMTLGTSRRLRSVGDANVAALRERASVRGGAYWGVVFPAGAPTRPSDQSGPATFVCGPDGAALAEADTADETVLFAEVPIEGCTRLAGTERVHGGGQAD